MRHLQFAIGCGKAIADRPDDFPPLVEVEVARLDAADATFRKQCRREGVEVLRADLPHRGLQPVGADPYGQPS